MYEVVFVLVRDDRRGPLCIWMNNQVSLGLALRVKQVVRRCVPVGPHERLLTDVKLGQ